MQSHALVGASSLSSLASPTSGVVGSQFVAGTDTVGLGSNERDERGGVGGRGGGKGGGGFAEGRGKAMAADGRDLVVLVWWTGRAG